jgi:hypothetical protein
MLLRQSLPHTSKYISRAITALPLTCGAVQKVLWNKNGIHFVDLPNLRGEPWWDDGTIIAMAHADTICSG